MSIADVAATLDEALAAGRPEMIFGRDPSREYRRLARLIHPDTNGGSPEATAAFRKLDELWRLATKLRAAGTYGRERAPVVTISGGYVLYDRIGRDDVADRFLCRWGYDQSGYARVVRKPRDNDLMRAEARVLGILATAPSTASYQPFLPTLVRSIALKQTGGIVRQTNVFENPSGNWYSLADVIDRHPGGIDPRDMAWMWRRLLMVLGAVHRAEAIHGAVLPSNVLIEPDLHGLILSNWSFSVPRGGRIPAVSPAHRSWYAPEVIAKETAGRGSDVYLAARTMLALVDPGLGKSFYVVPAALPRPLRAFFRACFLDARRRPRDAWQLLEDFDAVLERTYGPRRFRPFTMKGGTNA